MVKITAVCSEFPGATEPSHGFGVIVDDVLLFDSCSKEAAVQFVAKASVRPLIGIEGVPGNEHHAGGFGVFKVPVISPPNDMAFILRGKRYIVFKERGENLLYIDGVVISPCGLYSIPYHKLSRRGVKARCLVGGLGGTSYNPYVVHRINAELRLLGVKCVVALHTAPQLVKDLEKKFNVYRIGAGASIEI
ncbi:hypothetical protein [Pyrobaculum aerophilum]|uniref:MBL fold metallo-hydrolase n=1 Tax=Pyrobaculum aerophilum TaxID=13773 RepID=A0A371R0P1_9CREN|nr:hypothetical protein [Pyrobaculum aerophilum]RFA96870.1 hypothetical protein CGL51_04110 [Pyrobaculum aerophilum]RFA97393.1 hypothetical protein CGL52_09350 [Pyrobaculum aerophilum]